MRCLPPVIAKKRLQHKERAQIPLVEPGLRPGRHEKGQSVSRQSKEARPFQAESRDLPAHAGRCGAFPGRSMAPAFWPSPEQMKPPAPARPACPRRHRLEHRPISFRSRAPDKRPKVLMAKIRPDTRDLAEQAAAGSRKRAQKRPSGLCRAASMPSERGSISSQKPSACWARSAFCGSSCRQSTWNCRRASCQRPFQPGPAHRRAPSDPCLP